MAFCCITMFFVFYVNSQNINITGTVTGMNGQHLENVDIFLVKPNLSTKTDATGKYTIAYTPITDNPSGKHFFTAPRFIRSTVSFSISRNSQLVRIDVFSIDGKHVRTILNRQLSCGAYSFPVLESDASSQMYLIAFQVNSVCLKYKYLHISAQSGNYLGAGLNTGITDNSIIAAAFNAQSALPDTIKAVKGGYTAGLKVINSYQGVYNLTLDTSDAVCARIKVIVQEDSTFIPIKNADVVLYNSNTNRGITRQFSDSAGICYLYVQPNIACYLKVAAQNYKSSPPPNGAPTSFQVGDSGTTLYRNVVLKKNLLAANCGTVSGTVKSTANAPVAGSLVIAIRQTDSITVSGFSGPDGFYILYNIPEGLYNVQGFLEGWYQATAVTGVTVTQGTVTSGVNLQLTATTGSSLSGRVTFLATQNGIVDITLAHPVSFEPIPGLDTLTDASTNYTLHSIPPGTYIPWASYRNDGYVMDPDWIRKFGLPIMTFVSGDTAKTLNFSITGAVTIISPTNHKDTLVPVPIFTATPTFTWNSYPSTQEYIIAVYNSYGELVWGGYDANNNILHTKISAHTTSVVYNFDGSAKEPLKGGQAYRWKVWADKDGSTGVQQLISASEDLLGLFELPSAMDQER